jgi:hypothetical protein
LRETAWLRRNKGNIVSREEVLTKYAKFIGRVTIDPLLGLREAIIAHKARKIAQSLRESGIENPKIGVVVAGFHYPILDHLTNPHVSRWILAVYGKVLKHETNIGQANKIEFGKKWTKTPVVLK